MHLVMLNKTVEILKAGTVIHVMEDTTSGLYVAIDGPMRGHAFAKRDCERLYSQREFIEMKRELFQLQEIVAEMMVNKLPYQQLHNRIKHGVQDLYVHWTSRPSSNSEEADCAELVELISNLVVSELKL